MNCEFRIQLDPDDPLLPRIDLNKARITMNGSNLYGRYTVTWIGDPNNRVIYDTSPTPTVTHSTIQTVY